MLKKIILITIAVVVTLFTIVLGATKFRELQIEKVREEYNTPTVSENEASSTIDSDSIPPVDVNVIDPAEVASVDGDVCTVWKTNYNLYGEITDTESADLGRITYAVDEAEYTLNVSKEYSDKDIQMINANAPTEPIPYIELLGVAALPENVKFHVYGENVLMYNTTDSNYYTIVPATGGEFFLAVSQKPFLVTTEPATFKFKTADVDPLTEHKYSMYETTAIEATKNALTEKGQTGSSTVQPTTPTTSLYTNAESNTRRADMVSLANQTFDSSGHSTTTDKTVDFTSTSVMRSRWILENQTAYSFEFSELKISGLSATRAVDGSNFTVFGTIQNVSKETRPYVILIEYLDKEGGLLGISCVDKRSDQLKSGDSVQFQSAINSQSNVKIKEIHSLQFIMY